MVFQRLSKEQFFEYIDFLDDFSNSSFNINKHESPDIFKGLLSSIVILGHELLNQIGNKNVLCYQIITRSYLERCIAFSYLYYSDNKTMEKFVEYSELKELESKVMLNKYFKTAGYDTDYHDINVDEYEQKKGNEYEKNNPWGKISIKNKIIRIKENDKNELVKEHDIILIEKLYSENSSVSHGNHFGNSSFTGSHSPEHIENGFYVDSFSFMTFILLTKLTAIIYYIVQRELPKGI